MDINTSFYRLLLKSAQNNIRKAFPDVKVASRDVIGVCGPSCGQYFVEIRVPSFEAFDNYYTADNRYEAKAKAWMAFFDKFAPEQIKRQVKPARSISAECCSDEIENILVKTNVDQQPFTPSQRDLIVKAIDRWRPL